MNVVVFITASNENEAKAISEKLLTNKEVACVNIVPGVSSFFSWQGKTDSSHEVLMVCKTKQFLFRDVVQTVKSMHSYKVPEIIALPIIEGEEQYIKWLNESVKA